MSQSLHNLGYFPPYFSKRSASLKKENGRGEGGWVELEATMYITTPLNIDDL